MKIIKPIKIWQNGTTVEANRMSLIVQDNLKDAASFYYTLYADDNAVANGGIAMGGEDYENWDGSNDFAYEWVAKQINVEIIGDYEAPIIEPKDEPILLDSNDNVGMANINPIAELEIAPEPTVQETLTTEEPIAE